MLIKQAKGIADHFPLPIELNPVFSARTLNVLERAAGIPAPQLAQDEDFWEAIRREYITTPLVNLNNGGVSPQPVSVQEAERRLTRLLNYAPAYQMWQVLEPAREFVRQRLARLAGADTEEIAIQRNTTEAMANLIYGIPLAAGDEVVLAYQDYPNVIECWKNRAERDSLRLVWVELPPKTSDDGVIIDAYLKAFTPRTRAMNLTHMINWTGRMMPVREIATEALSRGIQVLVDAAHTFQQVPFRFEDIPCTGIAAVLHKWLSAPFGTGMLYVPKENIPGIRPIFPLKETAADNIRKYEGLGTRNYGAELAILHAIDFMEGVGLERKTARFQFLKHFWTEKAAEISRIHFTTPLEDRLSCNLVHFSMESLAPAHIEQRLLKDFSISAIAFEWANVPGIRITPNIYTTRAELDRLVDALAQIAED